jgi:hypothetical protein
VTSEAQSPRSPRDVYNARRAVLAAEAQDLSKRSGRLSALRGVSFLAALGLGLYGLARSLPPLGWGACGVAAALFVAFVVTHGLLVTRESDVQARLGLLDRALGRLDGKLPPAPEGGGRKPDPKHPYAVDLDVFGAASLFQLLDDTRTEPGEERLAAWLATRAAPAEIASRQQAVRDLAGRDAFREDLAALGLLAGTKGKSVAPLLAWAEQPSVFESPTARLLVRAAFVLVPLTVILLVLGATDVHLPFSPTRAALIPLALQLLVLGRLRADIEGVLAAAASKEAPFGRYRSIFARIEAEPFEAERLVALQKALKSELSASGAQASFERILGFVELRNGGILYVVINTVLLWDVFCAAALERFRSRAGRTMRAWFDALGEIEALASLGTFAFERPDHAFPVVEEGPPRFLAEGLGHPLIPAGRRVDNDVALPGPGTALLITGSNMSGKSTLLRAMGLAAVLAQAGAPVCARRLTMTPLSVWTSMRISDSLEQGVSHFYAELEKLKAVVDAANRGEPLFFLLDEVLHGTNSRERHVGARAVVLHVLGRGAIGALTSHDVALADLEAKSGGEVRNVHFEDLVQDGRMTFDYKLKTGVVSTTNALRLMKLVGIAVSLPEVDAGSAESEA